MGDFYCLGLRDPEGKGEIYRFCTCCVESMLEGLVREEFRCLGMRDQRHV